MDGDIRGLHTKCQLIVSKDRLSAPQGKRGRGSCCSLASIANNLLLSRGINLRLLAWSCVYGQLIPQRLVRFKHSQTIRMQLRSNIKGGDYSLFAHKEEIEHEFESFHRCANHYGADSGAGISRSPPAFPSPPGSPGFQK